jgi:hypothetical protein
LSYDRQKSLNLLLVSFFQIRYEGNTEGSAGSTMPAQYWKTDGSFVTTVKLYNHEADETSEKKRWDGVD